MIKLKWESQGIFGTNGQDHVACLNSKKTMIEIRDNENPRIVFSELDGETWRIRTIIELGGQRTLKHIKRQARFLLLGI